jgi:hypothetical protein
MFGRKLRLAGNKRDLAEGRTLIIDDWREMRRPTACSRRR